MASRGTGFLNDFKVYSVTEQIADHIKQAIIYGDLKEGEKLPSETEMAETLHVSRNTIRGALYLLSCEKLIETRPGRSGGHYVSTITENAINQSFGDALSLSLSLAGTTIEEVIEQRRIIEVRAAYLAALRRTDDDLQRLKENIHFLNSEPMSDLIFCKNNYLFNQNVSLATKNRLINLSFVTLARIIVPLFKYINVPISLKKTLNEELEDIYTLIYNQDPMKAAKKMGEHLSHFEEYFKDVYPKEKTIQLEINL
ncbi:FadR family transcriptional regulator [Siminovitchia acidinfaciens]|uniref:FadR family transcriptional regulator n=1 Tax=Siminovitchia acidinfaciens TaxID=2321395 RepID=A0A429Y730_9BACI|nr:GntR family transcriptional regulator [Siminovitchia acidinfaciens]RST77198.1 FadR family transcriptional regulator [Siminovitchia acidinfaciens]